MADKPTAQSNVKAKKDGTARKAPVRKDLKPLDFGELTVTAATPDVMRQFKRTRGERDKEQVAVDNLVKQAYDRWVSAGRPETWAETPGLHIRVKADQFETIETRARRSGVHYDFAIRFGNRKEKDGYAEVVLIVKDKTVREKKGSADGTADTGNAANG